MKQIASYLFLSILLLSAKEVYAQPYGNEWIDYTKTYYKFKVGEEGVYRIPKSVLNAIGVPQANGSQYVVYCNGVEVPLYVTTNGAFGANDYIEFFGEQASGQPDTKLFANPNWQADVKRSLFTDTAAYFLTVNNLTTNARFINTPNNITNPPPALGFCYTIADLHYKGIFLAGKHYSANQIFFSTFDHGEGFVDVLRYMNQPFAISLNTPNVKTGQTAKVKLALLRNTYNSTVENVRISLNNQLIADSSISMDETKHFDLSVPSNLLSGNSSFQITPTYTGLSGYDLIGCSYISVRYPRDLDIAGLNYFKFELPASSSSQYMEFQNFNHGNVAPRLYDLTNRKWYSGDIATPNITKFNLDPSLTERTIVLIGANSTKQITLQTAKPVQYVNYANSSNQGDYVIVTQKNYAAITNGRNYVEDFKEYRASSSGGDRVCIIAHVDDLYDQFAYGLEMHPSAIRYFMEYAYDTWSVKPHDLFLIGKGVFYSENRTYASNPSTYGFVGNLPPYGYPGSDVDYVNFVPNGLQAVNVGRLSAWTPQEVGLYLDKVKTYEAALNTPVSPDYETELWKKKILHAAGGTDAQQSQTFLQMLTTNGAIMRDTSFGGMISNVAKTTADVIDETANFALDSLINSGLSMAVYHGHASQSGFELSTLNDPYKYKNAPKFPHFLGLGCDVAHIFTLSTIKTIGENYLYSPLGGSISMIASDNLQFAQFHANYLPQFYTSISKKNYGARLGDHARYAYNVLRSNDLGDFTFFHLESMLLQGDPALKLYSPLKPDYHVSANRISSTPVNVTTDVDSFSLKIVTFNLARAIRDTVDLKIEHINPAGTTTTIRTVKVANLFFSDSVIIKVPVNKINDLGLNRYRVTIDNANKFDEMSEMNNTAMFELFIYSDNLVPVYPPEFSIVNQQGVTLKASTLNPFRAMGRYKMEIDTTELFNSSLKQQTTISSLGGVIKWTPTVSYSDSTVYYWRTALDSVINNDYRWTTSSFIYLANSSSGWNQSHYYQYKKDSFNALTYNTDRIFKYPAGNTRLDVYNAVYSQLEWTTPWNSSAFCNVTVNGFEIQAVGCPPWGGTVQVVVLDSLTTALWSNEPNGGKSGSYASCLSINNKFVFEFPANTIAGRNNAKHFLDSIPDNHYVMIKNVINDQAYDTALIDEWKADENVNGVGQSLYHTIYNMGFTMIDSFNKVRPFIFFRKKNNNNFPITQAVARKYEDTLVRSFNLPAIVKEGDLSGTVIGPAKEWQTLKWKVSAIDGKAQNDTPSVRITGIDTNNVRKLLYTAFRNDSSLSLAFIDAEIYPNIQLQWHSYDSVNRTSPQLNFWRVLYSPVPEAALNPAVHFVFEDSLQAGQMTKFAVAVENLTTLPMDSMLVRYKIIDANGVSHPIQTKRYKPLAANDTLHASLDFDPSNYPGTNVFFIEANPDNDQKEQYHPNNLGYIPFKVITDQKNPLLDVTFDGVHILDKDIVSAKPFIKIVLRDENQFLKLDDTALLSLKIKYPSDINNERLIPFDGNISKFIPAKGNKNEAFIEYRPTFAEDGTYELIINGRDKTGNVAGKNEYRISFDVKNKATITNVLNYPNPFSTSTAFVFTLTGSQVPTQFKIQILTVTGKVVREITRQELGNIHIGRNITDYKWDGKDQFGQTLGNGVYFYRVVTSLNGNDIEHNSELSPGTDKFFKNGYGKMYIMR